MRILVVGGAGYIGSHAVRCLLNNKHEVVVLDNLVTGHQKAVDPAAKFYYGDLLDTFLVQDILRKEKIDAVMHFAAYSLVPESVKKPLKYFENNVTGMISLIKAMQSAGVDNLIFSSSAATYGMPNVAKITEETEQKPINPYGETKLMMEHIIKWSGIKYVALRYFNVGGSAGDIGEDHNPETHLIPNILSSLNTGKEMTIFGDDYDTKDGTNVRDYVEVNDLADAHLLALEYLLKTGKSDAFNLGTANGYSNLEIVKACEEVTGIKVNYHIGPRRGGDPDTLIADSTKARSVLGWKPQRENVKEVIKSAWEWHKNHSFGFNDHR
ncbi:MAG: UDP-glucose 4-epimerase GalE [Lactobacillus sp.]|nr:UDP-glucose 4-epimerase GalE [Lactobacillus sp.]